MLELGQDGAVWVGQVGVVVFGQRIGRVSVFIGIGPGVRRVERSEEGGGVGADFGVFWIGERPDAVRLGEPVEEDEDDPEDGEERVEKDGEADGEMSGEEEGEFEDENEEGEACEAEYAKTFVRV